MNIGIILAAGKGTRFGADSFNKTTAPLNGKPLVRYGADLLEQTCDETVVVVKVHADTVKQALDGVNVVYADQGDAALGTGYAAQCGVDVIRSQGWQPEVVVLGYGDHMMFYTEDVVHRLAIEVKDGAAVAMVSANHDNPSQLRWGRVIRAEDGTVKAIVEEKEATDEEKAVTELNAGFYAFDYTFLQENIDLLQPAAVSGELYITDLISMAVTKGKRVAAVNVPFELVGYGINTKEDLIQSENLKKRE